MFNFTNFSESDAKNINSQTLAFVGDAVYSLFVRNMVVLTEKNIHNLHKCTTEYVRASGQKEFLDKILPNLNPTELAVFKRARNYKTTNVAKNAKVTDYRKATGIEAVIGYLYLSNQNTRMCELLEKIKEIKNNDKI